MGPTTRELLEIIFFFAMDCTTLTLKQNSSHFSVIYASAPIEVNLDPTGTKGMTELFFPSLHCSHTGVVQKTQMKLLLI